MAHTWLAARGLLDYVFESIFWLIARIFRPTSTAKRMKATKTNFYLRADPALRKIIRHRHSHHVAAKFAP